ALEIRARDFVFFEHRLDGVADGAVGGDQFPEAAGDGVEAEVRAGVEIEQDDLVADAVEHHAVADRVVRVAVHRADVKRITKRWRNRPGCCCSILSQTRRSSSSPRPTKPAKRSPASRIIASRSRGVNSI